MRNVVLQWLLLMQGMDNVLGLVLFLCGMGFLLTGWQFARVAILFTYAIMGASAGYFIGEYQGNPLMLSGIGLVSLFGLGYVLNRYASPILSGTLGSLTFWTMLGPTTVPAPTIYIVLGLAFLTVFIFSVSHVRETIIVITSFVGALFIVSGIVALASNSRTFGPHYQSLSSYGFFFPFLLLVPTISGILIQHGAARSQDNGSVS